MFFFQIMTNSHPPPSPLRPPRPDSVELELEWQRALEQQRLRRLWRFMLGWLRWAERRARLDLHLERQLERQRRFPVIRALSFGKDILFLAGSKAYCYDKHFLEPLQQYNFLSRILHQTRILKIQIAECSSISFQNSSIGWPQQPPTEKMLKFNMMFNDSSK